MRQSWRKSALQPVEHRDQPVPTHCDQGAIRRRGGHKLRTELWRFAGVDLTRIDGIGTEAALTLLTEAGLDLTAFPSEKHFVSWLRLAPKTAFSAGKPLRPRSRGTDHSSRRRPADGGLEALQDRSRRRLPSQGPPQGMEWPSSPSRRLAVLVYRMLRYFQDCDIGEACGPFVAGLQMLLSLLVSNWFHKSQPLELRGCFRQVRPPPPRRCASLRGKTAVRQ